MAVHTYANVSAPEETKTVLTPWTASTEVQSFSSSTRATDPGVPTGTKYVTVRGFDAIRTDCIIDKMCAGGTVNLAAFLRRCKGRKAQSTRRHEDGAFTAKVIAGDV